MPRALWLQPGPRFGDLPLTSPPGGGRQRMFRTPPESRPGDFSGNRQPAAISPTGEVLSWQAALQTHTQALLLRDPATELTPASGQETALWLIVLLHQVLWGGMWQQPLPGTGTEPFTSPVSFWFPSLSCVANHLTEKVSYWNCAKEYTQGQGKRSCPTSVHTHQGSS